MKKFILALFLVASVSAFAQTQPTQPASGQPPVEQKEKEKKEKKDKAEKEPKEKKEKKDRFKLVGLEAGLGYQYYQQPYNNSKSATTTSSIYRGLLKDDSPFWNYFGDNTPSKFFNDNGSGYVRNWERYYNQVDVTAAWVLKKKNGDINKKHLFKIGISYAERDYLSTSYGYNSYYSRDTTGYTVINGDSVIFLKDSLSSIGADLYNSVAWGQVSFSYAYRILPTEKLSLSLGGGIDIGAGTYTTRGNIYRHNQSRSYGRSIDTPANWSYFDYESTTNSNTTLANLDVQRFKAFVFRPYLTARIDYRLSKGFPILKNINLFTEGRVGKEFSNIGKKLTDKNPGYLGLRFGVTYYFGKSLK